MNFGPEKDWIGKYEWRRNGNAIRATGHLFFIMCAWVLDFNFLMTNINRCAGACMHLPFNRASKQHINNRREYLVSDLNYFVSLLFHRNLANILCASSHSRFVEYKWLFCHRWTPVWFELQICRRLAKPSIANNSMWIWTKTKCKKSKNLSKYLTHIHIWFEAVQFFVLSWHWNPLVIRLWNVHSIRWNKA